MISPSFIPHDWSAYLRAIRDYADRGILFSFIAILLLGLIEGSALLVLIPMLQSVGIEANSNTESASRFVGWFQSFSAQLPFLALLGIFLVLVAGQTLAKTKLSRLQTRLQVNFTYFLRDRLHRALRGADWTVFLQLRSSDVVRAFTSEVNIALMGITQLSALASALVLAVVQITAACLIAPAVTLTAILVGSLIVLIVRPIATRVRHESRAGQMDRGSLAADVTDHVGGLKLAKSHGAEERHAQTFQDVSHRIGQRQIEVGILQTRSQTIFRLTSAFALCLVLWYAVDLKGIRGAELAIMAVIFMRLVSRMMAVQSNLQRMAHVFPAYRTLEDIRAKWIAAQETPTPSDLPKLSLKNQLSLQNVTYHYPQSERPALADLSLTLPAGQTTALCGHSGAGKSTLADLVLGLIPPTKGQITIDDIPLEGSAIRNWRRSVAYVPQDVFLLNDTIRENLIWLSPQASDEEIWTALENAALADFVRQLPSQLETVVGERGVRLSGGERQRIALARALLRQPSLLVLDEATSALDSTNERHIQSAIDQLHGTMTILIIAHRLSTIRHADQIIVLEKGHVAQTGTWDQLSDDQAGPFGTMISSAGI